MNYVIYKTEIWQRAEFSDETDMDQITDLIKKGEFNNIFDRNLGFEENVVLYDTEVYIDSDENLGDPTLEVYQYNKEIYNNGLNENETVKIRNGVFETNSSSTHSIVINPGKYHVPKDANIYILTGEFGWEIKHYSGFYDKASYALTYALNCSEYKVYLKMLNEALIKYIAPKSVITYNGYSYKEIIKHIDNSDTYDDFGYIDHNSYDEASKIFDSSKNLEKFLFSSKSYFKTDNDNH